MAKDLPYFKFFCSEWNDGDIALEDLAVQGLFINLCSYYWSNECNVTLTKCKKKFKTASDADFDNLLNAGIIKVDKKDNLLINFLLEQQKERIKNGEKNASNGALGGRPKKPKQNPEANPTETQTKPTGLFLETQDEPNEKAIREEEKRKEKIREEKKKKDLETPKVVLNYLFEDSRINELWSRWKTYKQVEKKQKYKAVETEQQALQGLFDKSNGIYEVAESIVNFSVENLYSGLFVQKSTQVQKDQNQDSKFVKSMKNALSVHEILEREYLDSLNNPENE